MHPISDHGLAQCANVFKFTQFFIPFCHINKVLELVSQNLFILLIEIGCIKSGQFLELVLIIFQEVASWIKGSGTV
jgi:hypothetical protein